MASVLRKVWLENPNAEGGHWLRYYIASITRGVLKIDPEELHAIPGDIRTYLGDER
jgi:hypothetical protein